MSGRRRKQEKCARHERRHTLFIYIRQCTCGRAGHRIRKRTSVACHISRNRFPYALSSLCRYIHGQCLKCLRTVPRDLAERASGEMRDKDTTIDNNPQGIQQKLSRCAQLFLATQRESCPFDLIRCLLSANFVQALKKKLPKSINDSSIMCYASGN